MNGSQKGGCGRVERLNRRTDIIKGIKIFQRSTDLSFRFLSVLSFYQFKQTLTPEKKVYTKPPTLKITAVVGSKFGLETVRSRWTFIT